MLFLQMAQAPVVVQVNERYLRIPKFLLEDLVAWGALVGAQAFERATADMDASKIRDYRAMYPSVGMPDLNELKRLLRTPDGITAIVRSALPRAEVFDVKTKKPLAPLTEEEIEKLIASNGTGRLGGLTWILADVDDSSIFVDPATQNGADPLTESGKQP